MLIRFWQHNTSRINEELSKLQLLSCWNMRGGLESRLHYLLLAGCAALGNIDKSSVLLCVLICNMKIVTALNE